MTENALNYLKSFYSIVAMMPAEDIENIMQILHTRYGTLPDTELKYENNYQLLIAIMLSAQSTDKQVNKITTKLFSYIKYPQDAVNLGEEKINKIIKSVNYHNTKAKNIVLMSKKLIQEYNSMVPNDFDKLVLLNGVGRKTANLLLSIAFQQNRIAVDTHVHRVANRLGMAQSNTPKETEVQLAKNIPLQYHRAINSLFIPLGREFCGARKMHCQQCPVAKFCAYKDKTK